MANVPISISAYGQEQLDRRGVKDITSIARLTPGLNFQTGSLRQNNISIRGISSPAGASTTGIYIDDTPIQARLLGNSASNAFPRIFDLDRIEVLRGPQGTLFGAGAQGGAVRFITPTPSLTSPHGYARAETSVNAAGGFDYEAGVALGAPIVEDVLAVRGSIWFRRDSGFIDRVVGNLQLRSANGSAGPYNSLNFVPTGTAEKNSNWTETTVGRLAVAWQPSDALKATASLYYQKEYAHDLIRGYWPELSDKGGSDFAAPLFLPTVDAAHMALPASTPNLDPSRDRFFLPSLAINYDAGPVEIVSNTAYFDRRQRFDQDYTYTHVRTYAAYLNLPRPGDKSVSHFLNTQKTFSQELRLQSTDPDARLRWVIGGFYSDSDQIGNQDIDNNFYNGLDRIGTSGVFGVNNGAPFGPGYTALQNFFGIGLVNGQSYVRLLRSNDKQMAAFGQVDWDIVDRVTLTVGLRYAEAKFKYDTRYDGPSNNLNTAQGRPCVPGTGTAGIPCSPVAVGQYQPGTGPFAPSFVNGSGQNKDTPLTPKFGVNFQVDEDNLVYASAAKGFRVGGAQGRLPSSCDIQLVQFGYTDGNGNARSPETFGADNVWSYEVGSKNKMFDGLLQLSSSVYYIKWKNIQSTVSIQSCTQSFVDNLGSATSKGGDLLAVLKPARGLELSAAIAYNDPTFDEATLVGGRQLYSKGSAIPDAGAPWTVTLSGNYYVPVGDNEAYFRYDYTYNSRWKRTGSTDPSSVNYDAQLTTRPSTNFISVRGGYLMGDLDVSLFVDNLLNAAPNLNLTRQNNTPVYTNVTFRPRTIGVTARFRY